MRRFHKDDRGAVSVITAGSLFALLASAALAIDVGSLYLAKRRLQGAADAAALAAASSPGDASGAATRALDANGIPGARVTTLTPGTYVPDRSQASDRRFVAGGTAPDADRVTVTQDVPLFFGRIVTGGATTPVTASTTAARIDLAAFSIGSRMAGVQGGLPGALLSALAGSSVSLSLMDYNALLGADVDVFAYVSALRTRMNLVGATYATTLAATTTLPTAVQAIADVVGNAAAAAALRSIAVQLPATPITPGVLIDPGVYGARDGGGSPPTVRVDAFSLLRETLAVGAGNRQLVVSPPAITGLASVSVSLALGQRMASSPYIALAKDGSVVVRTAQARLYIDAGIPGAATLGLVSLRLPLYVELAQAEAKLAAISCRGGPANASVTLAVRPAIGTVSIADLDASRLSNFASPMVTRRALIAHALLLDVTGAASVSFGGTNWQNVTFTRAEIDARTIKTVSTNDLTGGIVASLVSGIDLRASALGLGVNLSGITGLVGAALTPAAPLLDGVLSQLTGLLGIGLGQADVRVDGVRCGKPTLVG